MMLQTIRKNSSIFALLSGLLLVACDTGQSQSPLEYPEAGTAASNLYVSKCTGCHAAPLPSAHIAAHWPGVIDRMQMRMTSKHVEPLSATEIPIIVEYLQRNARP